MTDISSVEKANHLAAKQVRWRTAVGRFLLAFSEIEWFTYHLLSELPTERIFESVIGLRFTQRVELVIQLVRARIMSADLRTQAIQALRRAADMAKTRNLVAHNPLFLSLFDDRVGVNLEFQISKYGQTGARIDIGGLEALCREIEDLCDELAVLRDRIDAELKGSR